MTRQFISLCNVTWWRHQMETFSALLAICAGTSPPSGEFLVQRPVTRSFDVFFDLCLNKRLRKQSWGWWFETLLRPLWRHCNDIDGRRLHQNTDAIPNCPGGFHLPRELWYFAIHIHSIQHWDCCWLLTKIKKTHTFSNTRGSHCKGQFKYRNPDIRFKPSNSSLLSNWN